MESNAFNLATRGLLEAAALVAVGYWGWQRAPGGLPSVALALLVPLALAAMWATFRVPGESPSGRPPVATAGPLRLLLELAVLGFAVWALFDAGASTAAGALGLASLAHYALSYRRLAWLVKQ